jgi:phage baseplate assembly protein W
MDTAKRIGQGLGFPPRIGPDGQLAWSSGGQNVRESIRIILLTEPQERLMLPDFGGGLQSFLFKPNTVTTHRLIQERIIQELSTWEPRISLESVQVAFDPENSQGAIISINYRLAATGTSEQLNLSINLSG